MTEISSLWFLIGDRVKIKPGPSTVPFYLNPHKEYIIRAHDDTGEYIYFEGLNACYLASNFKLAKKHVVRVSSAQVQAAKCLIKLREGRGEYIEPAIYAIADARKKEMTPEETILKLEAKSNRIKENEALWRKAYEVGLSAGVSAGYERGYDKGYEAGVNNEMTERAYDE